MFNSDSPITKLEDDSLGRDNFAKNLGNMIIDYSPPNKENLVIGIAGEWGSGKSSLMNMVIDHIEQDYIHSGKLEYDEIPIIMRFNPWRFSDQDQLISQFFYDLSLLLGNTDYQNIKDIARRIELYASFFEPVGIALPPFGIIIKVLKKYLNSIQELMDYNLNDLDKTRDGIDKSLKSQNHKIIIALDDIDRLNVHEIHLIFQLIKILANFPNTVYLIGFDRDVVSAALENKEKNLSGADYLEKIVQVIFEIPHTTENEVKDLVIKNLEKDFIEFKNEDDRYYFENLYEYLFKYYFRNIRNLNRYINTLKLIYSGGVIDDVFYIDFYTITVLQVFSPQLYHFIKKNKSLLTYNFDFRLNYPNNKEEIKKEIDSAINNLKFPNQDIKNKDIENFLMELFPNLKRIYTNWDNTNQIPKWKLEKRICIERNFETYFKFAVPSWEIPKKEFERIIYSETDEIIKTLLNLPSELQIKFIYDLRSSIANGHCKLDEENKKNIIEALLCISDILLDEKSFLDPVWTVTEIINDLLKPTDSNTAFVMLKDAIIKSKSIYSISILGHDLFGKHEDENSEFKTIKLNKSDSKELNLIVIEKIKTSIYSNKLKNLKNPFFILLVLKELGNKSEIEEYMKNITEDDLITLIISTKRDSIPESLDSLSKLIDLQTLHEKLNLIISSDKIEKEDLNLIILLNKTVISKLKPKSFVDSIKN